MPAAPPPGFTAVPAGPARLWVRAGLEPLAPALLAAWSGEAAEWLEGGRAAHPVIRLPDGGAVVVRRFLRGGALRHLNRDRYFLGDRAAAELRAVEAARRGGVRVPEVVAVGKRPAGAGYRAMLATRRVPGSRDVSTVLAGARADERLAVLQAVGEQLAAMHAAGVAHPDVNLRNVLVDAEGQVWLIDFDRARRRRGSVPRSRRARDLLRLGRSAAKLGVRLGAEEIAALRAGYGADWPLEEPGG